ncbi:hypothetical protein BDF14DRAFT_1840578 [Spinellus fusiger]|nr:hypothetical protein BDF14DRAFT_1840578 [Spinellus fusiger]
MAKCTHNLFQKQAPIFSGTICNKHTEAWVQEMKKWKGDLFDLVSNHLSINLVKTKLEGPAATAIAHKDFTNLDELYSFLKDRFPHYFFQSEIQTQLEIFTRMAPLHVKCSNFEVVLEMFKGFAEMAPAVIPRLKRGNKIKNSLQQEPRTQRQDTQAVYGQRPISGRRRNRENGGQYLEVEKHMEAQ